LPWSFLFFIIEKNSILLFLKRNIYNYIFVHIYVQTGFFLGVILKTPLTIKIESLQTLIAAHVQISPSNVCETCKNQF